MKALFVFDMGAFSNTFSIVADRAGSDWGRFCKIMFPIGFDVSPGPGQYVQAGKLMIAQFSKLMADKAGQVFRKQCNKTPPLQGSHGQTRRCHGGGMQVRTLEAKPT